MRVIKLTKDFPVFLSSEIMSSPSDDCIVCVFNSRQATIIRSAMFPVAYWETRLGERLGDRFIVEEDDDIIREFRDNVESIDYKLSGDEMTTCFDGIKDGLLAIANSMSNCCATTEADCGDTTITVTPNGVPVTGDTSIGVESEGEGEPPEGFTSWENYFERKCKAAHYIADCLCNLLNTLSTITLIEFVAVSAALGLFWAAFPPLAIGFLVAALSALALTNFYLLPLLSAELAERKDAIVCSLYNSATTGEAIDGFLGHVDDAIEDLALSAPLPALLKAVVVALCDAGLFSLLFDGALDIFYSDADCTECEEGSDCPFESLDGSWNPTITKISANIYEVEFNLSGGHYGGAVGFSSMYRTLESIEEISGTYDGDYQAYTFCDEDSETTEAFYPPDPLGQLQAILPIDKFRVYYCSYQNTPLTLRFTFLGDCQDCGEESLGMIRRDTLTLKDVSEKFSK